MESAFAALVKDLADRGLLNQTLVINAGEFGRTSKINGMNGRDHRPNVYSTVVAGGGVRGGAVYGESDSRGAEVLSDPVSPADVLSTMWHSPSIHYQEELRGRLNRPFQLSDGRVLIEIHES